MKRTHEIKTGGDGATRTAAMANDDVNVNIYINTKQQCYNRIETDKTRR